MQRGSRARRARRQRGPAPAASRDGGADGGGDGGGGGRRRWRRWWWRLTVHQGCARRLPGPRPFCDRGGRGARRPRWRLTVGGCSRADLGFSSRTHHRGLALSPPPIRPPCESVGGGVAPESRARAIGLGLQSCAVYFKLVVAHPLSPTRTLHNCTTQVS